MALNLQQLQKQTQRLIMTPQMQQSIQLLQLNSIELEQLTQQELLENPFLAVDEESPEPAEPEDRRTEERVESEAAESPWDAGAGDDDAPRGARLLGSSDNGSEPLHAAGEPEEGAPPTLEAAPEHFDDVDLNWDDYYSDTDNAPYFGAGEDAEEHDFTEYTAARTSLNDNLLWQLRTSSLDGLDAEIGEYLIGSLDDDGYLSPNIVEEVVEHFGVDSERAQEVLDVIQEFDPPGIAARSLAEALLNQMHQLGSFSKLAQLVLEQHMDMFQRKKFRELSRLLNVDESKLNELYHKVCRLEPHPGRSLTRDSVHYIQADVFVKVIDGEMIIYLNEGTTRRLSIDHFYRRLLRQQQRAMTAEEKEYAVEKYRSALTLLKNIEKRKSTILRVTEAIMEVQRQFLDRGVEVLRPLTLREVAEMVGMHESTVARVTSRKYVETPQGTYPLKFFFSSSIDSEGSEAVSSRVIKDRIQSIVAGEEPKHPLSDQKIVEILQKEGFDIARRTVAKYREQLKILPAKYRKQT